MNTQCPHYIALALQIGCRAINSLSGREKPLRALALINGGSGLMKTTDVSGFVDELVSRFSDAGHSVEPVLIEQVGMSNALAKCASSDAEMLIAVGGDGTISAVAEVAWKNKKILCAFPGGTMNLYANTLGIPIDLSQAVEHLSTGRLGSADIATANGQPFINQYTIGFQPRAVQLRNRMNYASRVGKVLATLRAMANVMTDPPSFPVVIEFEDGTIQQQRSSALSIANNVLAESNKLYANSIEGNVLAFYRTPSVSTMQALRLILDLVMGTWAENDNVDLDEVKRLFLRFPKKSKKAKALRDGELVDLPDVIEFEIHHKALNVWLPKQVA